MSSRYWDNYGRYLLGRHIDFLKNDNEAYEVYSIQGEKVAEFFGEKQIENYRTDEFIILHIPRKVKIAQLEESIKTINERQIKYN